MEEGSDANEVRLCKQGGKRIQKQIRKGKMEGVHEYKYYDTHGWWNAEKANAQYRLKQKALGDLPTCRKKALLERKDQGKLTKEDVRVYKNIRKEQYQACASSKGKYGVWVCPYTRKLKDGRIIKVKGHCRGAGRSKQAATRARRKAMKQEDLSE